MGSTEGIGFSGEGITYANRDSTKFGTDLTNMKTAGTKAVIIRPCSLVKA